PSSWPRACGRACWRRTGRTCSTPNPSASGHGGGKTTPRTDREPGCAETRMGTQMAWAGRQPGGIREAGPPRAGTSKPQRMRDSQPRSQRRTAVSSCASGRARACGASVAQGTRGGRMCRRWGVGFGGRWA
ncbi:hypothetical protein LTR04_005533, partial [Oleoguttula sp. CCFEE 6159]